MNARLRISPSYFSSLRNLHRGRGKIFLMYRIIRWKKEMPKLELLSMTLEKSRGKDLQGNILHAYRLLRLLKVICESDDRLQDGSVRFVKDFSPKELVRLMKKNGIEV